MKLKLQHIKEVVNISFYGRSGSFFLQSLLDNHPNILMVPGDYLRFYFEWWEHVENYYGNCLDIDFIIEKFEEAFPFIYDAKASTNVFNGWDGAFGIRMGFDTMGENQDQILKSDKLVFKKELRLLLEDRFPIKCDEFFKAIHIAYFYSIGREYKSDKLPIIVYHSHKPDLDEPKQLFNYFNNVKTLCMVREPIQSLGSLINTYRRSGKIYIEQMLYILKPFLYDGVTSRKEEETCAIKLEDLHINSRETLESICRFLNIPWNNTLMESTFDGLKWWNAKGSQKVNGFNQGIVNRRHEELFNDFDRDRIMSILHKKYMAWNYKFQLKYEFNQIEQYIEKPFVFEEFIYCNDNDERLEIQKSIRNLFVDYYKSNLTKNLRNEVRLLK